MKQDQVYDQTFGISSQAFAVAAYLADKEPDFAEFSDNVFQISFKTRPWYNGRERGIVITMSSECADTGPFLHIAFFEHRNSDEICCLRWETKQDYWNHPLEDQQIFEVAYHHGGKSDVSSSFGYGKAVECARWIYGQFEEFYYSHHKYKEMAHENRKTSSS